MATAGVAAALAVLLGLASLSLTSGLEDPSPSDPSGFGPYDCPDCPIRHDVISPPHGPWPIDWQQYPDACPACRDSDPCPLKIVLDDKVIYNDWMAFSRLNEEIQPYGLSYARLYYHSHNTSAFTATNTGASPVTITGFDLTGPFQLKDFIPTPYTLAPGQSLRVSVLFYGNNPAVATELWHGSIIVRTDASPCTSNTVWLAGFFQVNGESCTVGGRYQYCEPDIFRCLEVFGIATAIWAPGEEMSPYNSPANHYGSWYQSGEEVMSDWWQVADPTQPVYVQHILSLRHLSRYASAPINYYYEHGANPPVPINVSDVSLGDAQLVYPRQTNGASSDAWFTPIAGKPWAIMIGGVHGNSSLNYQQKTCITRRNPTCGKNIRWFPFRTRFGNILPGSFVVFMDYDRGNWDFNDNIVLVHNVRPKDPTLIPADEPWRVSPPPPPPPSPPPSPPPPPPPPPPKCAGTGYVFDAASHNCYQLLRNPDGSVANVTRDQAAAGCASSGGFLATTLSSLDVQAVRARCASASDGTCWINLNRLSKCTYKYPTDCGGDRSCACAFTWGSPVNQGVVYKPTWAPNQPDSADEACVVSTPAGMDDVSCGAGELHAAVCQAVALDDPTQPKASMNVFTAPIVGAVTAVVGGATVQSNPTSGKLYSQARLYSWSSVTAQDTVVGNITYTCVGYNTGNGNPTYFITPPNPQYRYIAWYTIKTPDVGQYGRAPGLFQGVDVGSNGGFTSRPLPGGSYVPVDASNNPSYYWATGGGVGLPSGSTKDQFYYLFYPRNINERLVASGTLNRVDVGTPESRAGFMTRTTTDNNSPNMFVSTDSDGNLRFSYRSTFGGPTVVAPQTAKVTLPVAIKLTWTKYGATVQYKSPPTASTFVTLASVSPTPYAPSPGFYGFAVAGGQQGRITEAEMEGMGSYGL